jgi:type IV secretion system protein VirD4
VLDPFGVSGLPAVSWNPLAELHGEAMSAEAGAIAAAMVTTTGREAETHWADNGRELLRMLILHVCTTYDDDGRDLLAVRRALMANFLPRYDQAGKGDGSSTLEAMAANDCFDGIVSYWAEGLLQMDQREQSGIISTARTQTQFLDDPRMRRALVAGAHSVDLSAWQRGEALSLFLCLPASHFRTFSRWLRLCT